MVFWKKLKNDRSIVILQPDKGNGVAVLEKTQYDNKIKESLINKAKFKKLHQDVPIKRQTKLEKWDNLEKKWEKMFKWFRLWNIHPSSFASAKICDTPKMHNLTDSVSFPALQPITITSSPKTFN